MEKQTDKTQRLSVPPRSPIGKLLAEEGAEAGTPTQHQMKTACTGALSPW
jgi:hypothetical protein